MLNQRQKIMKISEVPADKLSEMALYGLYLRRKFPHFKKQRIIKKVGEYFKIKLVNG